MKHQSDREIINKSFTVTNSVKKGREFLARSMRQLSTMSDAAKQNTAHLSEKTANLKTLRGADKQSKAQAISALTGLGTNSSRYEPLKYLFGKPKSGPAATTAFCTNCGTKLNPGEKFCRNCGRRR